MWNLYIHTDKKVVHNPPESIIHNKKSIECTIIDVLIPVCKNIVKKEVGNTTKCLNLEIELIK